MTRKEAIDKIYGMSGTKEQHEALEFLIPRVRELRESYERQQEDKRIRKELVEAFEALDIDPSWNGIPVKSILTWLKDQKPVSNPKWTELTWEDINTLERIINNVHYEFQHGIGEESFGKEVLERFREYKDDDSMDEQKPAEKNITNEEITAWSNELLEFANKKMQKLEWSEEDEKLFWELTAYVPEEELKRLGVTRNDILKKLKSIRPQPIQIKEAYKEGFQTARHVMALAFMSYLDENRPDGKMDLSTGECEDIDCAFKKGDCAKIMRYYEKYRSSWKPSEDEERLINISISFLKDFADKGYENAVECIDWLKSKLNEKSTNA